ncbi:MAG: hypothetical protein QM756_01780 [Polyangiaceae bacterium]
MRIVVGPGFALLASALVSYRAGAEPVSREFDAAGVVECPSANEFWQRLAAPLEQSEPKPQLRVSFVNDARGVRGRLEVRRPGEPPLERRVLAPTCAEAAEALGIVIEQMSTTGFRELEVAAPEPTAPEPAAPDAPIPSRIDVAQRSQPPPRAKSEPSFRVELGASARSALPTDQPWGAFAALSLSPSQAPLHTELSLRARWHPLDSQSVAGGVVEFQWWAAELAPSLRLARLTSSLELRAGAVLSVGRLTSTGRELASPRTAHSPWVSLSPELALRQHLGERWLLALAVAGELPLVGAEVRIDGYGSAFRSPALGFSGDLSLGVRFEMKEAGLLPWVNAGAAIDAV